MLASSLDAGQAWLADVPAETKVWLHANQGSAF